MTCTVINIFISNQTYTRNDKQTGVLREEQSFYHQKYENIKQNIDTDLERHVLNRWIWNIDRKWKLEHEHIEAMGNIKWEWIYIHYIHILRLMSHTECRRLNNKMSNMYMRRQAQIINARWQLLKQVPQYSTTKCISINVISA